jgi:hypothetical protein
MSVGVTLWKIRPPTAAEARGARLFRLKLPGAKVTEQVPERVDPKDALIPGDQFRLSVEVPFHGYLYVIDREQYKDGALSEPHLIYPNYQTRRGDNALAPGRVIEIPDRRDEVNAFLLEPERKDQVAEVLSLLITPEPLSEVTIPRGEEPMDRTLYAGWEEKWRVEAQQYELVGSQGTGWTEKEDQAGADHGATLTQEDPLPQTMYRVNVKPGSPFLILAPLKIKQ